MPRDFRLARLVGAAAVLVVAMFFVGLAPAVGKTISQVEAAQVARNWLSRSPRHLGSHIAGSVGRVETIVDRMGSPSCHVVRLQPRGFVVVASDDAAEPVICFSASGSFAIRSGDPLSDILRADSARIRRGSASAAARWKALRSAVVGLSTASMNDLSDVRVSPLLQTTWGQSTVNGAACYNYYTPTGSAGSAGNYPAGCVATAMAQLMRYHQYPTAGIGASTGGIQICDAPATRTTRGGDGLGGAYDWAAMPLDPTSGVTEDQRMAIGALCFDAGVSVGMDYCDSGSGALMLDASSALQYTFLYGNTRYADSYHTIALDKLYKMINPNLDAALPVLLGIERTGGGHAVVCDGYGYDGQTMYHHINMGWDGEDDIWYNLPNIDTSVYQYSLIDGCLYNVYPGGSGEIVSGRVLDPNGNPISGAQVTASGFGSTTNSRGTYALAKIPSSTNYTIMARSQGYVFPPITAVTGNSASWGLSCGNVWGANFTGVAAMPVSQAKTCPDAATPQVACQGVVVTAVFSNGFYVESADRSAGIFVEGVSAPARDRKVDLIGTMSSTGDGERCINASVVDDIGPLSVGPIGMPQQWLSGGNWLWSEGSTIGQRGATGAKGANNIGLLVVCYGTVTYSDQASHIAYVNDGSGLYDGNSLGPSGTPVQGVRLLFPATMTVPSFGAMVWYEGISGLTTVNGACVRAVRVRT